MEKLAYLIFSVFGIAAVSGHPRSRSGYGYEYPEYDYNYTDMYPTERPDDEECDAIIRRDRCSGIIIDALSKFRRLKDIRYSFQHYCRKIPDYVPCLEENKGDYMVLIECDRHVMESVDLITTSGDISRDQLWDMSIDLLDTVNDIVCSRTDELLGLIMCVVKNGYRLEDKWETCASQHASPFLDLFVDTPGGSLEQSGLCGSTIGFGGCIKDAMSELCEDSTALLDTIYDDVIVDVIGNGFGCEPPSNPLLSFVRSVRDKLRR